MKDAMLRLDGDEGFKAHYEQDWIDPIQRLDPGASNEEAYKLYKRNIEIGYAAADNAYLQARYDLGPDQALVMRGRFPRCRFANVVIWNHRLQTPPYRYRNVSLNRNQIQYEADGSYRVVIAHRDPGVPNWIDTAGQTTGMIFWRFLLPQEQTLPVEAEVVDVDSLS